MPMRVSTKHYCCFPPVLYQTQYATMSSLYLGIKPEPYLHWVSPQPRFEYSTNKYDEIIVLLRVKGIEG
jgi:hypothetical protein